MVVVGGHHSPVAVRVIIVGVVETLGVGGAAVVQAVVASAVGGVAVAAVGEKVSLVEHADRQRG